MGRHFIVVSTVLALSILAADVASAQNGRKNGRGRGERFMQRGRQSGRGPERVMRLSPEERQTFRRNAERWLQMDAQQRNVLRERERVLREQRRREAEAVLHDSGLRLDNGARAQFEERYFQERRRIEQTLRQEIEAKRQQELQQFKERLKNEFQPHQASPTLSVPPPGASGGPRD